VGGRNLFLSSGPKDQRSIEQRDDIVLFTSDILPEDLEVTGQIFAKIFCVSDKSETDVIVRLTDVYPDGRSILIADGLKHVQIVGTDPQEVTVDLWSTSIVFAKGHRIRVSVSASNYPRYEKCSSEPSQNKVLVGDPFPSQIILPVVKSTPNPL
jgi:uncharacterized protein